MELKEYTSVEIIRLLGNRFREYRLRLNLTQQEVASRSGLSALTISKFESGNASDVSLSTLIQLLKVVGRLDAIDELLPELPESPYLIRENKKVQRIRH